MVNNFGTCMNVFYPTISMELGIIACLAKDNLRYDLCLLQRQTPTPAER